MNFKNSSKTNAIKGFATDFGGQIFVIVINILTIPLILKYTSSSLYGFWITCGSIIGFLALTDFGIGVPLTRSIAKIADRKKYQDLNILISTGFFTLIIVSFFFLIFGITISFFISKWFDIPVNDQREILPAFYVSILSSAIALPLGVFSIMLNGFQQMAIDNIIRNILTIISVILTLLLLFLGYGLLSIAISNLIFVLSNSVINFFYAKKIFPELKIRLHLFNRIQFKKLLNFGGLFQIGRLANTIAISADNLVIASILGANYVTPYTLTSKLPNLFSINIASKLPIAVFPAISKMFEDGNLIKLESVLVKITNISVRLAVLAATFVFLANKQFITLWVGVNNYGGTILNLVFVYWILQDTIYRGTTAFIFASGNLHKWATASIAEAILNVGISVFLANKIGIVGVALGTSISKTLTTGIFTPYFICKELNISFLNFIKKGILKPFLISIPGIILAYFFSYLLPQAFGWAWILFVGVILLFFNILFFEGKIFLNFNLSMKEKFALILKF